VSIGEVLKTLAKRCCWCPGFYLFLQLARRIIPFAAVPVSLHQ
jgi:hypothetical protein